MTDLYNIEGKTTCREYLGEQLTQKEENLIKETENELKYFLDIYPN